MINWKNIILSILFSLYLYYSYHLLVTPLFLDFSILGVLIGVIVIGIMFALVPRDDKRKVAAFTIGFLLLDKALFNNTLLEGFVEYLSIIVIIAVIAFLCKTYGKLSKEHIAVFTIVALVLSFIQPRDEVRILTHFTKSWDSGKLYAGTTFTYFPLEVADLDGDGIDEIITFGNMDEESAKYEERKRKFEEEGVLEEGPKPFVREPEPIYPYVFKWNGQEMERIPVDDIVDQQSLINKLVKDYPGFPYYSVNDEGDHLYPMIQKQALVESMMQMGTSPFLAMNLDIASLDQILKQTEGRMDKQDAIKEGSQFSNMIIKNGIISGMYNGESFEAPTDATTIIGSIQLDGGNEGLLLLGKDLTVHSFVNDEFAQTHQLTEDQLKDLRYSEFIIADINNDQADEILVSAEVSSIIKPNANGQWDMLWKSRSKSFRFEDYAPIGNATEPELITLDKNTFGVDPLRYVTSYTYTDEGLERNWKMMLSLINLRTGDIDGDNENELIATIYQSHNVIVFEKHSFPLTVSMMALTFLLIIGLIVRRVRYGKAS